MPPITGMASYEQVARTQQDMIRQKGAHYAQKQVHYICGKLPNPMQIMILHQCGARVSSFFDPEHTTTASWHLNLVSEKAKSASPYLKKPVFAPSPMHCTWQSPRNSQCSSCLLSPQCRHGHAWDSLAIGSMASTVTMLQQWGMAGTMSEVMFRACPGMVNGACHSGMSGDMEAGTVSSDLRQAELALKLIFMSSFTLLMV